MGIIPGPLVEGPQAVGNHYGLLTVASGPIDLPEHGRGGGVRYVERTCGEAHPYPIDCSAGVVYPFEKQGDPDNATFDAFPFIVTASIECGSIGYTSQEFIHQVKARLQLGEQGAAELALWTGMTAAVGGTSLGINALADTTTDIAVGDSGSPEAVLAALEAHAYRTEGYGGTAYIHAPVEAASWFGSAYLVVEKNGIKYTPFGSIWVFGGGYPGTGADGTEPPTGGFYMYVTGQVAVWRSADVFTYPIPQTLDRTNNQYFLLAEREYAIGFDCGAGRILFDPLGS